MTAVLHQRSAQARALLDRARSLATEADLSARIDATLAYLRFDEGDVEGALRLCDDALANPAIGDLTAGVLHNQRALILSRTGDFAAALAEYDSSLRLLDDPVELGKAYINRGAIYVAQADVALAVADLTSAVDLLTRADHPTEAAMAEHNLGCALLLRGDLVSALAHLDAARPTLLPLSPVGVAICNQDRAEVLIAAGMVSQGRSDLREAARVYGQRRLHQRRGEAELTLARTLLTTDPAGALVAAREARRRFVRVGTTAWRARAESVALAAEVDLGRQGPALLRRGEDLIGELTAQGMDWPAMSVRAHTARVMIRRRDLPGAHRRLGELRLTAVAPLSLRLLVRDVGAELAVAEDRRADAARQVRAGLADLHTWQSTFGSLDLQTLVVGHGRRLARRGLDLAVQSGDPRVLYEWSERARMLVSRVQPVRAPADEQMAADLSELRQLTTGESESGARLPRPRRTEELRTRVRERAWQQRGSGEVSEPAPMAEIQAALGAETALVAWVVTGERVAALVLDDRSATYHELGRAADLVALLDGLLPDLDVAAADLPDRLARSVRGELAGRLDDLGALLVAPLLHRLGDRRLVLTPSGLLAGTPWTLLPGLVGRPVTVAQSATSWLGRLAPLRLRDAGFVAGPRVERAEAEVTEAAALWQSPTIVLREGATASAVAELAGRVEVLHIAAHGRHSSDNPLFSGLELAGGPWYGYDIDQLPAVPQVVLLSACEVGRSTVRYGEELIGMTAAWLHAGVRYVVASPAAVNDAAAHEALTALHAGLSAGLHPADALAAAVPPPSPDRAPAPFVCFG